MNLFKVKLVVLFHFFAAASIAQVVKDTALVPSVKQLTTVEVSSIRLSTFSSGNKSETLDSALLSRYATGNLADLLANESQVFIKSYGLGSSATSSFRGAGANHTAILWNGFNIQSPMLGMLDISLVPINFLNEVKLQYGSAGALWGTGAVGGTIHLNSGANFNKGFSASANVSYGSFMDKQQQLLIEISKKRLVSSIKLFNHDAKNNFPFINIAQYGKPEQKQSNAEFMQYGLLQENYFQINARQQLNTHFWYQFSDRNIPPSMTQNRSIANQKDIAYRYTSEWQHTGEKLKLFARAAYFNEQLNFVDSSISEHSKSLANTVIAEAESKFSISKYDLVNVGINNTYNQAKTPDYINRVYQNRTAVFASYKIHNSKNTLNTVISARKEFIKNKNVPFVVSIGSEAAILKLFVLKANVAKHYRLPTFNDLYWAGYGAKANPTLMPESGWSEEVSLIHKYSFKKINWELGATAFNRTINNWIIWLPNTYNSWSPENVTQVWSRGLEYKLSTTYQTNNLKIQLNGMYNYILSTNEKSIVANDITLHKQLIYVPIQNAQGSFSIAFKGASFTYTQVYTGYRYTTSDNAGYLKPYTIGNINVSQTLKWNGAKIKIYVQLNNVWKENYQVIENRAMPLYNYQFGAVFYFTSRYAKKTDI